MKKLICTGTKKKIYCFIQTSKRSKFSRNLRVVSLASFQKNLNQTILEHDVEKLLNFEKKLASATYSTDDTTRRTYKRSLNNYTEGSSDKYKFVNITAYFEALSKGYSELTVYFSEHMFDFYVMEPDKIAKLSGDFDNMDKSTVANYLNYRLLIAFSDYLPEYRANNIVFKEDNLGRRRRGRIFARNFDLVDAFYNEVPLQCAYETLNLMQYANARFYIDYLYPTEADRGRIRK